MNAGTDEGCTQSPIPALFGLVVDDDPINLEIVSDMLRLRKWSVTTTHSGTTAVVYALHNRYELIFMDLNMPSLDGREAMLEIRRQEVTPSVIIAMSAGITQKSTAELKALGFNNVLVKPFTCKEVFKICAEQEMLSSSSAKPK